MTAAISTSTSNTDSCSCGAREGGGRAAGGLGARARHERRPLTPAPARASRHCQPRGSHLVAQLAQRALAGQDLADDGGGKAQHGQPRHKQLCGQHGGWVRMRVGLVGWRQARAGGTQPGRRACGRRARARGGRGAPLDLVKPRATFFLVKPRSTSNWVACGARGSEGERRLQDGGRRMVCGALQVPEHPPARHARAAGVEAGSCRWKPPTGADTGLGAGRRHLGPRGAGGWVTPRPAPNAVLSLPTP